MLVQACATVDYDAAHHVCANPQWIDFPALIPPLPVDQGLMISGVIISIHAVAWGYKYVRRYLSPKTG